jgi:hypothetical protein
VKVSLVNVVMLGGGVILLYSGIKGYDPRDVIRWGLGGKKPKTFAEKDKGKGEIKGGGPDHPDPGQRHPGDMPWTYPPDNGTPAAYV